VPSDGWHPGTASPSLIDLMSMEESGWEAFSRGSAIRRAGRAGFLRNLAVGRLRPSMPVRDALTLECDAGANAEMMEALGLRSAR
jgi:epoxyqueuosine reductase QueG